MVCLQISTSFPFNNNDYKLSEVTLRYLFLVVRISGNEFGQPRLTLVTKIRNQDTILPHNTRL